MSGLFWFWQLIDPPLLNERLLESLFYIHGQPPGWNLMLGISMRLFPVHFAAFLHVVFTISGAIAMLCMHALLQRLGVSRKASAITAGLLAITPATLLFENWFYQEYLTMVLLVVAAFFFERFVSTRTTAAGFAMFTACASLIYIRSSFQAFWVLPVVLGLAIVVGVRRVALAAAVPLLLVAALLVKNYVVFGTTATSSWAGMQMSRPTVFRLDQATRDRLADAGILHGVSRVDRFASLDRYAPYVTAAPPTGIPLLDRRVKSRGANNFNNLTYIEVSRQLVKDSLWVMRNRPMTYLHSIAAASNVTFASSTDFYAFRNGNLPRIETYDRIVNKYVYLVIPATGGMWARGSGATIFSVYAVMFGHVAITAWKIIRRRRTADTVDFTLFFMAYASLFVMLISVLTEVGENHRIRYVVDPLALMCCVVAVKRFRSDG